MPSGMYVFYGETYGPPGSIIISTDLVNFSYNTTSIPINKMVCGNGIFVGANNPAIYRSIDGLTWDGSDTGFFGGPVAALLYANGFFVAGGSDGSSLVHLETSPDASTFISKTLSSGIGVVSSLAYGNGVYMASASYGEATHIHTSTDINVWTATLSSPSFSTDYLCYGNGIFMAAATVFIDSLFKIKVALSNDNGDTWAEYIVLEDIATTLVFYNGLFVLGTQYGHLYTSTDGINWVLRPGFNAYNRKVDTLLAGNGIIIATTGHPDMFEGTCELRISYDAVAWDMQSIDYMRILASAVSL